MCIWALKLLYRNGPKYVLNGYMDPLGSSCWKCVYRVLKGGGFKGTYLGNLREAIPYL